MTDVRVSFDAAGDPSSAWRLPQDDSFRQSVLRPGIAMPREETLNDKRCEENRPHPCRLGHFKDDQACRAGGFRVCGRDKGQWAGGLGDVLCNDTGLSGRKGLGIQYSGGLRAWRHRARQGVCGRGPLPGQFPRHVRQGAHLHRGPPGPSRNREFAARTRRRSERS